MLKGSKASVGTKPNREQWLDEAVSELSAIFKERGYEVPPVRVSCGFAHTSSRSVIGQCWSTKSSDAAINEIFISPKLADPVEVLDTLTHELVHAVDNCEHKHGKEFKAIAQRIGLQGKMREASAGPALKQKLTAIALKLGNYPHAKDIRLTFGVTINRSQKGEYQLTARITSSDKELSCSIWMA